jgi:EAL domain-containing protein (putative c-di-GMP-specific phosphodiesterase class I)
LVFDNSSPADPFAHLERYLEQGGPLERVVLGPLPFSVGRSEDADHTIYSSAVSKKHALFIRIGDRYAVRDLQSTNGTFVNGQRVVEQVLADGDIVHFAHVEFCFRHPAPLAQSPAPSARELISEPTQALPLANPSSLIRGAEMLRDLVRTEAVETVFEPIVNLGTGEVIGYEALSRGAHPELSRSPGDLLGLADQCGMAIELSRLFRRLAVSSSLSLPGTTKLFLNIHPQELGDAGLLASLAPLQHLSETHPVVLEIPESAVTDVKKLAALQNALTGFGVQSAFDDFGAGQTRLLELTELPPHYLKIDRALIHGIDAAKPRQEMVAALLKVAEGLRVQVIAEGIETLKIAGVCRRLGCQLGQGFLFERRAKVARGRKPPKAKPARRRRS